jgi:hypothetical protein
MAARAMLFSRLTQRSTNAIAVGVSGVRAYSSELGNRGFRCCVEPLLWTLLWW